MTAMNLSAEISEEIDGIFKTRWAVREGDKVPDAEDVQLGNDAVRLDGTVLYADLADSTAMVKSQPDWYAAEVYKSYLVSACRIIRENGGEITAFDGDRVMAVYIGSMKNTSAAKTALQINYVVSAVLNPKLKQRYPNQNYQIRQVVGIDTSKLFVARTGIRGSNDLVWVGRAANYAAKLSSLNETGYSSYITDDAFKVVHKSAKFGGNGNGELMWETRTWSGLPISIHRSNWWWRPG
jgi:class 3 adenylate cyclase